MYPSTNINSWQLVYEKSLILKQILQKYSVQEYMGTYWFRIGSSCFIL